MSDWEHIGAVFGDHAAAEAAVVELRKRGMADDHLGIALRHADSHMYEEDVEANVARGIERGIAVGAPIGAIAGITILAFAIPGAGILGVGGTLAAGGLTGALAGTFLGALLGLASEEHEVDEEWDWERLPLQPGEVLVVIADHGHPGEVIDVLQQHDGTIVSKPPHEG
jgi:hypothetical protein